MENKDQRFFKIFFIIVFFIFSYLMLHVCLDEVYFQRYPNIFVAFIEMYLHGYFTIDYISVFTLVANSNVGNLNLSNIAIQIMNTESFFPNMIILFVVLQEVTNISPQLLVLLPVGFLIIALTIIALFREYLGKGTNENRYVFFLLTVYILIFLASINLAYPFYVAPPSWLLIFVCLYCLKKIFNQDKNYKIFFVMYLVMLFSLSQYWHTALEIITFLTVALCLVYFTYYIYVETLRNSGVVKSIRNISTILTFFVLTVIINLSFIHLWQNTTLIQNIVQDQNFLDYLSKFFEKIFGGNPYSIPYAFNYKTDIIGLLNFYSILIIYSICILIFIVAVVYYLKDSGNRTFSNVFPPFLCIAVVIAQIANSILYSQASSINSQYAAIFFPLFGLFLLQETNYTEIRFLKRAMHILLVILIILSSILIFTSYVSREGGQTSVTKYADTEDSYRWVAKYIEPNQPVIVDFNILGKYLQWESQLSKPKQNFIHLKYQDYAVIVGDATLNSDRLSDNFVIIDHATMRNNLPIHVFENRARLIPLYSNINQCSNENKVFMDSYISIFKFLDYKAL